MIISIISILLDGIISNYVSYLPDTISYFYPFFTLASLFIIYPYYKKDLKKYYTIIILSGVIYDLLYTNLLFFNAICFLIIGYIIVLLYRNLPINYLTIVIYILLLLVLYYTSECGVLIIFNVVKISIKEYLYLITHTFILTTLYTYLVIFILNKCSKKYKKLTIN